ncbi:MAG TPA: CBS domain-containing protein, partial [Bacillales bacterium]
MEPLMKKIEDIYKPIADWVIPADKVAHVQIGNPLEHALLVLIKTGYS